MSDTSAEGRTSSIIMVSILVLMLGGLVYASIQAALAVLLILGGTAVAIWSKSEIRASRYKRLAKYGSGYVLAPEKKFWA